MLKDPNDWSSWQKILSVDLTNIALITFSEMGKFLVRQWNEFKLVEPCKEYLECFKGKHTNYAHMVMTRDYVESLISPFGASEADQGIDKSEDNKHLSAESMHLENKRPSLSHKSENNSSIGSNDFCGQSNVSSGGSDDDEDDEEDYDDSDDDGGLFGDSENLEDCDEVYSDWESTEDDEDDDVDDDEDDDVSDDEDEDYSNNEDDEW